MAKNSGAAALFFAANATDSAAISDMAPVTADPTADVLTALAGVHTGADLMMILDAVNRKLADLARLEALAAETAPTLAPVLADDVVVDARSALARHFNKAA